MRFSAGNGKRGSSRGTAESGTYLYVIGEEVSNCLVLVGALVDPLLSRNLRNQSCTDLAVIRGDPAAEVTDEIGGACVLREENGGSTPPLRDVSSASHTMVPETGRVGSFLPRPGNRPQAFGALCSEGVYVAAMLGEEWPAVAVVGQLD